MNSLLTIRVALRALAKNKMRAGLTVLGVVIGVAAVTTMVSLGESAGGLVQGELQGLGTNVIVVFPGSHRHRGVHHGRGTRPTLIAADSDAITRECPSVLAASPIVMAHGQVIYGNSNWAPREMVGVGTEFLTVRNWPLRSGGFFTGREITAAAQVCVIGQTIVEKLFQTTNPLGEQIRIGNIPFRVIGILEEKGANMVGDDQDNVILAPYTTVRRRLRGSSFDNVDIILASARSTDGIRQAQLEIEVLLAERHKIGVGEKADFEVQNMTEIAEMLGKIMGVMTALLAAIAGISLVVGGVGIMNIMLVSVTERTREIGIRMAVGARPRDILLQFLVESVLLSVMGGLVGLGLGFATSVGLTGAINFLSQGSDWPVVFSFWAAALAIGFSAAVGVFFGFYPARRASLLDPIEALRYE
jgi:putative ABC transport system permease protein